MYALELMFSRGQDSVSCDVDIASVSAWSERIRAAARIQREVSSGS